MVTRGVGVGAGGLGDVAAVRWARMRGPEEELTAIGRVLPRADAHRRDALYDRVVELAGQRADDVVQELSWWGVPVPERVRHGAVAGWVRSGIPDRFARTWEVLAGQAGEPVLVGGLLAELRRSRPAPGFVLGAVAFVELRLAKPDRAPVIVDRDLELLRLVVPLAQAGRIGHWQAMLGDTAARAGRQAEARRRWELAVEAGVAAARPRLAHGYAVHGRELLMAGNAAEAAQRYAQAHRLGGDDEFRVGELIARVVEGGVSRVILAAELERLAATEPDAQLWAGIAHVAAGDPVAGARLLRRAQARLDGPRGSDVAQLAGLAELDRDGARVLARTLLEEHGREWAHHAPCRPDRIVNALADPADADVELLDALLSRLPATVRLERVTRERAARVLLAAVVGATDPNPGADRPVITGTGTDAPGLDLVERLLAEDV